MTTNAYRKKLLVAPSFDHLVNSFFNSALGDVIHSSDKKAFTQPATNVSSQEDKHILEVALPGLSKVDIDINIEEDVLTISDKSEKSIDDDSSFRLREFNYKGFSKSYRVPEDTDLDKIAASFENGVLVIALHKKEEALPQPPKKITIK